MFFNTILTLSIFVPGINAQSVLNTPVQDIEGNVTTINDITSAEILVLDFWATWCKPCVKSIPKLAELSDKYKDGDVSFIGVNEDSPRNQIKVKPFAHTLGITYPVIMDADQSIMSSLLVNAFPTLVIIDQNENVLFVHEGFVPGDEDIIENQIKKIIESRNQND
jgi:cytochrome c biogenesis protein CcmG, thiol:disulfide interchange protein DsbE